jgi:hypothetical protein
MRHEDFHFPLEPIIVMLSELREQATGEHVKEGWSLVDNLLRTQFKNLEKGMNTPLHLAVANLAIKAWSAHLAESEHRRIPPVTQPESITMYWMYLQRLRASNPTHTKTATGTISAVTASGHHYPESLFSTGRTTTPSVTMPTTGSESGDNMLRDNALNPGPELSAASFKYAADSVNPDLDMNAIAEMYPVEDSPMDWVQWDDLLQQFQAQTSGEMDILFPSQF